MRRKLSCAAVLAIIATAGCASESSDNAGSGSGDYKVGVLLSLSGTRSTVGDSGLQGSKVAIAQINARNEAGRRFDVVYGDDASEAGTAFQVCTRFVQKDRVNAIVGTASSALAQACHSAARKAGIPYINATQAPGIYCEPTFITTGPVNNQLIVPLMQYVLAKGHRRIYLVGADTAAPRAGFAVAARYARERGAKIVGTDYVPVATTDFSGPIARIAAAKPDVVIDSVSGDPEIQYFKQLLADPRASKIDKASFVLNEIQAKAVGAGIEGVLVQASYFKGLDNPLNERFLADMTKRFGPDAAISQSAVFPYIGLHVLARAVKASRSTSAKDILEALPSIAVDTPAGRVAMNARRPQFVDIQNYIGEATSSGDFEIVGRYPSKPEPTCR
jgi:ABC-type branched-subunit amino acid transport system substrate-binding protein